MLDLDEYDRRILTLLQADSAISTQDLADRVGMSASVCWRRVRRLRDSGVIRADVVLVDPRKLGLTAQAYIHLSLIEHTAAALQRLDDFVQRHDQIVECATITGSDDYMMKVVAKDPEDLERFLMRELLALGVVRSSTSHFVLRQTKHTSALPVR